MEESIFVDDELQSFDRDKDELLLPSTSSLEIVLTSTLKADAPLATTSSTAAMEASRVEGRSSPTRELPLTYTLKFWIWYSTSSSLDLVGFSDADFTGCGIH
jgi:hypothetical protein